MERGEKNPEGFAIVHSISSSLNLDKGIREGRGKKINRRVPEGEEGGTVGLGHNVQVVEQRRNWLQCLWHRSSRH